MFDYHMHSRVSFDGHDTGAALVQAAEKAGLRELRQVRRSKSVWRGRFSAQLFQVYRNR